MGWCYRMIGIYKITNLINQKVYIGQSRNIKERWKQHRYAYLELREKEKDYPLYRAMRKYGLENFSFEVIEECQIKDLDEKEIYWINFYKATDTSFGYNLREGGCHVQPSNAKLNEDQVQQIKIRLQQGETQESIAKDYPVDRVVISQINLGKSYVHDDWVYPLYVRSYEKRKCLLCGKEITGNTLCKTCYNKKRAYVPLTREELKEKIRNENFSEIGKQFNKTGNAIKNWCKRLDLPDIKYEINSYSDEEWELV